MWRITIIYHDKSEVSFRGSEPDITLEEALDYFNNYVAGRICTATYQRYPLKSNSKMDFIDKIEQLQREAAFADEERLHGSESLGPGSVYTFEYDIFVEKGLSPELVKELLIRKISNEGYKVLSSEPAADVTHEYEDRYPGLCWEKVLETEDSVFYRHNNPDDCRTRLFSKISGRTVSGDACILRLEETLQAVANGIIKPIFISSDN